MKLPHDTLIAREKITEYLLKEREDGIVVNFSRSI